MEQDGNGARVGQRKASANIHLKMEMVVEVLILRGRRFQRRTALQLKAASPCLVRALVCTSWYLTTDLSVLEGLYTLNMSAKYRGSWPFSDLKTSKRSKTFSTFSKILLFAHSVVLFQK